MNDNRTICCNIIKFAYLHLIPNPVRLISLAPLRAMCPSRPSNQPFFWCVIIYRMMCVVMIYAQCINWLSCWPNQYIHNATQTTTVYRWLNNPYTPYQSYIIISTHGTRCTGYQTLMIANNQQSNVQSKLLFRKKLTIWQSMVIHYIVFLSMGLQEKGDNKKLSENENKFVWLPPVLSVCI